MMRLMARRDHFFKPQWPRRRSAQGWARPKVCIHHPDILHVDPAPEPGAHRLAEGLLGGEAFGVGAGDGEGAA